MSESTAAEANATLKGGSAQDYVRAAWSHQAKREFGKAEATFKKALELDAGSVDGQYGLAMTLKMLARNESAIQAFEKVISLLGEKEPEDKIRSDMLVRLAKAHIQTLKSAHERA